MIAVISDLAIILGVPRQRIIIITLRIGSLVIEYDLVQPVAADETVQDAAVMSATFAETKSLYRDTSGDASPLAVSSTVTVSSRPVTSAPSTPASLSESSCSTGCIAMIVVVVGVVLTVGSSMFLIMRRRQRAAAVSNEKIVNPVATLYLPQFDDADPSKRV